MFLNTAVWIKVMLAILVAFVVSIALTPFVKRLAVKVGAVDVPGEARRVHDHPIPRMGGLAIFLGFIVSTLLFVDITQEVRGILIGSIIIVITGVIDDIVSLRAWTKFLIQILAAVIAVLAAIAIPVFSVSLDKAGRAADVANARSVKGLLVTGYLDGTIQFPTTEYNGYPTALGVYVKDGTARYFASGTVQVNGVSWAAGSMGYERVQTLLENAGLGGLQVKAASSWGCYAVILYSDGHVRTVSADDSLSLDFDYDGLEASLASLPAEGTTAIEQALAG